VTTDVASNELLEALIHADELALMRMGERPRDPDLAKHWRRAHDARLAELERLRRRRAVPSTPFCKNGEDYANSIHWEPASSPRRSW
jgi:hypothetical protein